MNFLNEDSYIINTGDCFIELIFLLSQNFLHPPGLFYLWQRHLKYKGGIVSNGMMFIESFMKINQLVQSYYWERTDK
jgi:hypothetical protein